MAKSYDKTMEIPRDILYQLTTLQIKKLFKIFDKKSSIASLLEHYALQNLDFLIK